MEIATLALFLNAVDEATDAIQAAIFAGQYQGAIAILGMQQVITPEEAERRMETLKVMFDLRLAELATPAGAPLCG